MDWDEGEHRFAVTDWNAVWDAKLADTQVGHDARTKLCASYWQPVYHYLRRKGRQPADALDLTQEFFHQFLEKKWLNSLQDQRGKFRSFLLTLLESFLSGEFRKANAQKRGGGKCILSFDDPEAETSFASVQGKDLTPEQMYDRKWGETVMLAAASRLRAYYERRGNQALYQAIRDVVPGKHGEQSYAQIGEKLGMSEEAIKSAVNRMWERYARYLRDEIARTVRSKDQIEEELKYLIQVFSDR